MKIVNRDGCRNHTDTGCYKLRPSELRDVVIDISYSIGNFGKEWIQELEWGYSKETKKPKTYYVLSLYKDIIIKHMDALRLEHRPCLSDCEIQRVIEKARIETGKIKCGEDVDLQEVDRTGMDASESCVPYELWEKAKYIKLPKITPTVELKECLRFAYEVEVISSKEKACEIIYDLSVIQRDVCNIEYTVDVDLNKCQLEYQTIVENNQCEIKLDNYIKMRECGLSYEVISDLVECSITPIYEGESGNILLKTPQGNTYNYNELNSLGKINK